MSHSTTTFLSLPLELRWTIYDLLRPLTYIIISRPRASQTIPFVKFFRAAETNDLRLVHGHINNYLQPRIISKVRVRNGVSLVAASQIVRPQFITELYLELSRPVNIDRGRSELEQELGAAPVEMAMTWSNLKKLSLSVVMGRGDWDYEKSQVDGALTLIVGEIVDAYGLEGEIDNVIDGQTVVVTATKLQS